MFNRRHCRAGLLLGAWLLPALPCLAGLDLLSMHERNRALDARAGIAPEQPAGQPAEGSVSLHVGARPAATPALLGDAIVGGSGVSVSHRLVERNDNTLGVDLRFGVVARFDDEARLDGTSLGIGVGPGEFYLSQEARHWGPGWFGSLILDAAAPPVAAVGWRGGRRYLPDASCDLDVFAGILGGHAVPAQPKLIGMHFEWRPNSAWTLGVARTLQWGGRGRDESFSSLANALIGRDTLGADGIAVDNEPGNQLAGLDVRYDATLGATASLGAYVQLVAEDFSGVVPTRRLRLLGVDAGTTLGTLSLRAIVELANTTAGKARGIAYRHHLYPAGYTHRGQQLGHPAGGDVHLASAALLLDSGPAFAMLALHGGRAQTGAQRFVAGDELRGADLALTVSPRAGLQLGVSVHYWRAGLQSDRWGQLMARYSWP